MTLAAINGVVCRCSVFVISQFLQKRRKPHEKYPYAQAVALGVAAVFVFALLFAANGAKPTPGARYALAAPSFVEVAHAAVDNEAIELIQSEAGMSAYFQSTTPVTINSVRSVFQTIELETTEYILGTVALANYPEDHAHTSMCMWTVGSWLTI